jgi:hypothetical protein
MPNQGDIVMVAVDPDLNNGTPNVPAIITRVWPDQPATDTTPDIPAHISCRVLGDADDDVPHWTMVQEVDTLGPYDPDNLTYAVITPPAAPDTSSGDVESEPAAGS